MMLINLLIYCSSMILQAVVLNLDVMVLCLNMTLNFCIHSNLLMVVGLFVMMNLSLNVSVDLWFSGSNYLCLLCHS